MTLLKVHPRRPGGSTQSYHMSYHIPIMMVMHTINGDGCHTSQQHPGTPLLSPLHCRPAPPLNSTPVQVGYELVLLMRHARPEVGHTQVRLLAVAQVTLGHAAAVNSSSSEPTAGSVCQHDCSAEGSWLTQGGWEMLTTHTHTHEGGCRA